jgi:hypothetical protein
MVLCKRKSYKFQFSTFSTITYIQSVNVMIHNQHLHDTTDDTVFNGQLIDLYTVQQ